MTLPNIRIFRGGSPVTESVVQQSVEWAKTHWNVDIQAGSELFRSITPAERSKYLIEHLKSNADILWSIRGGEGTTDIIPDIEKELDALKKLPPKIVIGSSDTTALTIYLQQKLNWPTIHGMGFNKISNPDFSKTTQITKEVLLKNKNSLRYPLTPLNKASRETMEVQSSGNTGGNLSLLAISIKDVWEFNADNQIVFIEDWIEKAHVIDRSLKYLKRIGKFEKAKAIILGDMFFKFLADNKEDEEQQRKYLERQLGFFAESFEIPVLITNLFGHGPRNHPIPLTWKSEIKLGSNCEWNLHLL
jgi:muramoyltetrapeptide carboxypeptidase